MTNDAHHAQPFAAAPALHSASHVSRFSASNEVLTVGVGFTILGSMIMFYVALSQTLSVPIMLSFTERTDFSDAVGAAWATYLPFVCAAGASPIIARLSDLYGRRRMMLVCLGFTLVGSIIGPLGADGTGALITVLIGRSLKGIGFAVVPIIFSAAREMLPPARMISVLSVFGAALGIGGVLGAPLGHIVHENFGWRVVFLAGIVISVALIGLTPLTVPPSPQRLNARFDVRGAILLPTAIMVLLTVAAQGPAWGLGSPLTLSLLSLGLLLLVLWALTALRTRSPMVNLRVVRQPSILYAHLCSFGLGWLMLANALLVAMQIQEVDTTFSDTWSAQLALLMMLPTVVALLFVGPCAAVVAQNFGPKTLLVLGAVVSLLGFILRLYAAPNAPLALLWATVVAIGAALSATALPMILNMFSPAQRVGALNGMNWTMRLIGLALGATTVIHMSTTFTVVPGGVASPTWQAEWLVLLLAAAVTALVLLFAVLLPMPERRQIP